MKWNKPSVTFRLVFQNHLHVIRCLLPCYLLICAHYTLHGSIISTFFLVISCLLLPIFTVHALARFYLEIVNSYAMHVCSPRVHIACIIKL